MASRRRGIDLLRLNPSPTCWWRNGCRRSAFIVLGPLLFGTALRYAPWLAQLEGTFTLFRFAIAASSSPSRCSSRTRAAGGTTAHRRILRYRRHVGLMARAASPSAATSPVSVTYVSYYAGLASAMIALVFLYWTASIFVYGGALNAAIFRPRLPDVKGGQAPVGGV
jgi:membrane protein